MRSGIWTLPAGVCFTRLIAVGLLAATIQPASAQHSGSAYSRRLPHRGALAAPAGGSPANRAVIGAALPKATSPSAASPPSVAPVTYLSPDAASTIQAAGDGPVAQSIGEDEFVDSIWEPSESVMPGHGDGECCDGPACSPFFSMDHLSFYGGVQSSKNNSTRGQDASFGFHEGLNFGTAARNIILPPSVGLQLGFEATQANLEGASFTNDDRKQYFLTAGAFRRGDHGLQGGLVFDYLWDKWNYDLEAAQIRGEISLAISNRNSFGLWFANSLTDNVVTSVVSGQSVVETWDTVDYYAIFYRTSLFAGGRGEGQLMAGLTEDSDGIIGGKSRMPLINGWALETEFTYLVPDEPRGGGANAHESWNLGINLAWYPGSLSCGECFRYHRPMFDVANNGSMILRRQP